MKSLLLVCALACICANADAQAVPASSQAPPPASSSAARATRPEPPPPDLATLQKKLMDFPQLATYRDRNAQLGPPAAGEKRVVFFGDSITEGWARSWNQFFAGKPYIDRGISAQTTEQMVLRFHQDVIGLHPAVVVILAGINDVQGALQRETDEGIEANWEAMADMADAHGIKVVFASILPVNNYTDNARDMLANRDPRRIRALNDWLREFCQRRGFQYADYYQVSVNGAGLLRADLTRDGLHPLPEGYRLMAPVAQAAIDRALDKHGPHAVRR